MKLYIDPDPTLCFDRPGGVNTVVAAHAKHLSARGYELTRTLRKSQRVITHALSKVENPDIFVCHGVYENTLWSGTASAEAANKLLEMNILTAQNVVCVSSRTANIIKRRWRISPHVIRNGIDLDNYTPAGDPEGWVLWPKIGIDAVCNPAPLLWLAQKYPERKFITPSKVLNPNIRITGLLRQSNYFDMLKLCGVYLATTKEQCSLGTMEALAFGIPVIGYDWGFNEEHLRNKKGVILVKENDLDGLAEALEEVTTKWKHYHKGALETAKLFSWEEPIDELCRLIETPEPPNTWTIVIPCHNYGKFVAEAVESALNQTRKPDQIIVVDDASKDNSWEVLQKYKNKVTLLHNEKNLGVAESRNKAIGMTASTWITCLDADDVLEPNFGEMLIPEWTARMGINWGALLTFGDVGGHIWFKHPANLEEHFKSHNQICQCNVFARSWWERVGGYRKYMEYVDDADLWTRMILAGCDIRYVPKVTYHYRTHPQSATRTTVFPDYMAGKRLERPIIDLDRPAVVVYAPSATKQFLDTLYEQTIDNFKVCIGSDPMFGYPWVHWNSHVEKNQNVVKLSGSEVLPPDFLSRELEFPHMRNLWN